MRFTQPATVRNCVILNPGQHAIVCQPGSTIENNVIVNALIWAVQVHSTSADHGRSPAVVRNNTILFTWEMWIPYIIEGFRYAGVTASGRTTLNPSEIVGIGSDLQAAIGIAANDFLSFNPLSGFTTQLAGLVVLLVW